MPATPAVNTLFYGDNLDGGWVGGAGRAAVGGWGLCWVFRQFCWTPRTK